MEPGEPILASTRDSSTETCSPAIVSGKDSDGTLMQFTGLYDEDGTEIYESDILESPGWDWLLIYWHDFFGGWYYRTSNASAIKFDNIQSSKSKIIGNIFKNPELMEK